MELQDYIDDIKLQLTGDVLNSEIEDKTYEKIIDMSLREMNRYYNATNLLPVRGESCVDLIPYPYIGSVVNVYSGDTSHVNSSSNVLNSGSNDPWYNSQLQMYNIYSGYYNPNKSMYNMLAYNLAKQTANTVNGADLEFKQDKKAQKLYVNYATGAPAQITIEYIPLLKDVSDITSEYWIDILKRLSLAHSKVALGRIRTRYTQEGAQWSGDGDTILAEGQQELTDLRELLRKNTDLLLPID